MRRLFDPSVPTPTVVLGSTSPAKLRAVTMALQDARSATSGGEPLSTLDVRSVAAKSGVPDQPWGDEEVRRGAAQRARVALELVPHATLAFGIEGGVQGGPGEELWVFAWVVVVDGEGASGAARSAAFTLPSDLAEAVRTGVELGDALDAAHGLTRAKDGVGAVGILTGGLLDRAELYRPAVLLALIPWLAPTSHSAR